MLDIGKIVGAPKCEGFPKEHIASVERSPSWSDDVRWFDDKEEMLSERRVFHVPTCNIQQECSSQVATGGRTLIGVLCF